MNLAELLPPPSDDVRVHGPDGEWTADQLRGRAFEWADSLDIAPGTAVGTPLPNGGELIARLFGTWLAGGVYVPLNPRATATELERIGRDVERTVLARAVRWHLEDRVLMDGPRTVVF